MVAAGPSGGANMTGEFARVVELLETANSGERALFVAGVAERHLATYEALPADRQLPLVVGMRPLLDHVWTAACGDQTVFKQVARGLAEFYLSPYFDNEPDDFTDAYSPVADAVAVAAECYLHKCVHFPLRAIYFGADAAVEALSTDDELPDQRAADAVTDAEFARQLRDLELIRT